MPNTTADLRVGDELHQQFGPYRATATVVEVNDRGAVLAYAFNAVLVGFPAPQQAPDGTGLTQDPAHGFLGRSLWPAAEVVRS